MKSNNYTENKRGKHSAWISAFSSRKKVLLMGLSSVLLFSCTNDDIVNDTPERVAMSKTSQWEIIKRLTKNNKT